MWAYARQTQVIASYWKGPVVATLLLILPFAVEADILGDRIDLIVASEVMHDDNLFRTANGEESDTRLRLGVGLEGEFDIGRQNIRLDALAHKNRFSDFDNLDYSGYSANVLWNWVASDRFSGAVWGGVAEDLADFDEFLTNTRDKTETQDYGLEVGYNASNRFRIETSLRHSAFEHSLRSRERSNETTSEAELAILYRTPGGSMFGAIASHIDGEFPDRDVIPGVSTIDDGYEQRRYGATIRLNPGAKTSVRLDLGRTRREQDNLSGRDFSEPWWRFEVSWDPSTRLSFRLVSDQDIRSVDNADSSFVSSRSIGFTPMWTPNDRLVLSAQVQYRDMDFSENVGSTFANRDDEQLQFTIRGRYNLRSWLRLRVSYDWGDRDSRDPRFERSYNRVVAGLEVVL